MKRKLKSAAIMMVSVMLLSACGKESMETTINETGEVQTGEVSADTVQEGSAPEVKDEIVENTVVAELEEENEPLSDKAIADPADIIYADSYSFEKLTYGNMEEMDFSCLLEVEDATLTEGIYLKTDKAGYSGSGYLDITDNTVFSLKVDIPASQYYQITVRHCAGAHKENPLYFNGLKVMDIVSENGNWVETTVDGIFLEEGENVITLGAGWSWFSMDSILIEDGESLDDDIFANVSGTLSNPYANLKTQNIYQYLKAIYGYRTLAGQYTNYGTNTETDALYLGLGKYPAIRTFDFIYDSMSFCNNNPAAKDVDLAIEWSKEGGLVVFDWHWYAPCKECEFYSDKTSFTLSNAVTEEEVALLDYETVQQMYADGKISIETVMLIADIDNISGLMQQMEDENVTVLWRPLHEASGGWFWWGSSGKDAYKWLWELMYERMTNYHELDNLIWVWNGQHADWYPGDEYCDIVSMDIYGNAYDYGTSPATLAELAGWADNGKLVALSECAVMPDPELIVRDHAYWLWFAVWNWDFIVVNGTTELSDAYTSFEMMEKVYNSEVIITRDELPDFE